MCFVILVTCLFSFADGTKMSLHSNETCKSPFPLSKLPFELEVESSIGTDLNASLTFDFVISINVGKLLLIRVYSNVFYSRRTDGRTEKQATSFGFTGRHRHGDGDRDGGFLHVGLHIHPSHLQYQPLLYRGQSVKPTFVLCCQRCL